jgi:hypothetical protein
MSPYRLESTIEKRKPKSPPKRPSAVVAVALYQYLKAGLILILFSSFWVEHETKESLGNWYEDPLNQDPSLVLLPLAAALFVFVGWGIWRLQKWARLAPVVLVILVSIYWLGLRPGVLAEPVAHLQPSVWIGAVIVEATTIAMLYLLPDVTEAFGKSRRD